MRRYILLTISLLFFAFVFQSDNKGWNLQILPRTDLIINDMSFIDSLTGYCAGTKYPSNDSGLVYKTTNGGVNWIQNYTNNYRFNFIQFLNHNTGYMGAMSVGGGSNIFRTTNGGINWNRILGQLGFGTFVSGMFFINENTGWYSDSDGDFGGLYKTTNGGLNWQQQLSASFRTSKLFFINQDTGWVVASGGKLYRTNNSGINWNLQFNFSAGFLNQVFFVNKDTGYAVGGQTVLSKTINGGSNWDSLKHPDPAFAYVNDMYFINSQTGWFANDVNRILKTTNGGALIGIQSISASNNKSIQFINAQTGYVAGNTLYKTTDGGGPVVSMINNSSEIVSNYKLYQNFPNPFNPVTKINYELRIPNYVTLKVFDVQGKEIQSLVNKKVSAGNYSVEFNASNLSSGIYFYTLQTESFIDTKKMILLK
ncbi:MAG: T9SS type A sorting domain-containing protein [Ignavibacteria bacterium]|nr:T9SS type A sorting domain-containing protein [Ignavibacteria bacterium]